MNLAVYGTLKRGYSAHKLLGNSEFVCEATLKDHVLYKDHGLPVLMPMPGAKVECEIYKVIDPEIQQRLHDYEGFFAPNFPGNLYDLVTVVQNVDGVDCSISFYIYNGSPSEDAELLANGVW